MSRMATSDSVVMSGGVAFHGWWPWILVSTLGTIAQGGTKGLKEAISTGEDFLEKHT